jgi:hypothetical protein
MIFVGEFKRQLENLMPNEGVERFMDDESKYFSLELE